VEKKGKNRRDEQSRSGAKTIKRPGWTC